MGKEKKEIWKLLELLNEFLVQRASGYIHYHSGGEFKRTPTKSAVEWDRMLQDEYVLGKSFGFIKWLVWNDKIDEEKVKKEAEYYWKDEYDVYVWYVGYVFYHRLLMLLSISDKPIDLLCSLLK